MSRLPTPGGDDNVWGQVLNDFLSVSLNPDGTLIPSAVAATGLGTGTYSLPSGGIPLSDLNNSVQTIINSVANKYTLPNGGIPSSALSSSVQASLSNADSALHADSDAGGDLSGTFPDPIIAKLQGVTLSGSNPTSGQVLSYNGSEWTPATPSNGNVNNATATTPGLIQLAGDIGGNATSPEIVSVLSGQTPITDTTTLGGDLSGTLPSPTVPTKVTKSGDTMTGKLVVPSFQVTGGSPASGSVLTSDNRGNATWQTLNTGSTSLAGDSDVAISSPSNGQVLTYDSTTSKWQNEVPSTPPDANSTTLGLIQLDGDLGNNASSPEVVSTHLSSALPVNQGGTGSTAQNFVDLTSNQMIDGTKTFAATIDGSISGNAATATTATSAATVTTIPALSGDVTSDGNSNATTLTSSTNVESIISNNATVAGALQKANNLSDVSNAATSRLNLQIVSLQPAACVASSNVASLSGLNTYDGYSLVAGDIVLLIAQNTASKNGPWVAAAGAWTRPSDFNSGSSITARLIQIIQGNNYSGYSYLLQTNNANPIVVDTTSQTWVAQIPPATISGVSVNQPLVDTANNQYVNIPPFESNTLYPANYVIQDGGLLYARNNAGTSGVNWSADLSNWTLMAGARTSSDVIFASNVTPVLPVSGDLALNIGTLTGDITLENPSGSPRDGQTILLRFVYDSTGGYTIGWGTNYAFGTDITAALIPSAANSKWEMLFQYDETSTQWRAKAIARGF